MKKQGEIMYLKASKIYGTMYNVTQASSQEFEDGELFSNEVSLPIDDSVEIPVFPNNNCIGYLFDSGSNKFTEIEKVGVEDLKILSAMNTYRYDVNNAISYNVLDSTVSLSDGIAKAKTKLLNMLNSVMEESL